MKKYYINLLNIVDNRTNLAKSTADALRKNFGSVIKIYHSGYLPKYQKQNPARLHYLLREDLMKLDQITAQVRLLGREHISTSEQLFSYKSKVEDEIKTLTADRTHAFSGNDDSQCARCGRQCDYSISAELPINQRS